LTIQWLKDVEFQHIQYGLIKAREKLAWKEGLKEYAKPEKRKSLKGKTPKSE